MSQWFQRVFGDRYFIEIMNNGVEIQRLAMEGAIDVAHRVGLPLVATSDAHYVDTDDAEAQDVMLCINTGKFRTDTSRMRMDGNQYYLRSPEEMYAAFPRPRRRGRPQPGDCRLGRHRAGTGADGIFPITLYPKTTTADGLSTRAVRRRDCKERYAGNEEMLPDGELAEVVVERLDRELGVINKLGFSNYFLIVWDFVREARAQGSPGHGARQRRRRDWSATRCT